jgi:uncharacterized membrane protein SpoIIM required for sporulation
MEYGANPYSRLKELIHLKHIGKLSFAQVRELVALHERASADLSLAEEKGAAEQEMLRSLVAQSFNEVYGLLPFYKRPPLEFLRVFYKRTPEVLYAYRRHFYVVLAVVFISALFGIISVLTGDTITPRLVLSPQMAQQLEETVAKDSGWALAASIPPEERPAAGMMIMANNINIALISFILGLFLSYFTLIMLFVNGYMLGYVSALYIYTGAIHAKPELGWYFIAGIAPHGVLEIPAILLAASAGLAIGASWIFPGRRRRGVALAETARESLLLVSAAAILLVVAGLIEAFVTPLGSGFVTNPAWSTFNDRLALYCGKIAFSALLLAAFISWLRGGWIAAHKAQAGKAAAKG